MSSSQTREARRIHEEHEEYEAHEKSEVHEAEAQPLGLCEVRAEVLAEMLGKGQAVVVDVREPEEYARVHIAGAINMPLSRFDPKALPEVGDKLLVLHCQSSVRSGQAGRQILACGKLRAHHLQGGLKAWREAELPVVENRRVPISILRQVQIVAGSLVVLGTVLGVLINPWFLLLSGFVGAGLIFAGLSGTCGMAILLGAMPWNRLPGT